MKKILKRVISSLLVVVMVLTTAPLSGFAGLELPNFNSRILDETIAKISDFFDGLRIKSLAADNSYETNDKITFGEYPQGKVTDSAVISALNSTSKHSDGSYHYGDKRYAKVGSSWYVYEPIVWRVLSSNGDYVYAFSEKLLDAQPYHTSATSVTWDECSLNHWLNNEFYNTAFDVNQRYCISTGTEAKVFSSGTSSNVFLLTYNDCINTNYGFNRSDTYDDSKRVSYSTAYSQAKGLGSGSCDWIIRSNSSTSQVSYSLAGDGCIGSCHGTTSVTTVMGIKPAVVFDTSSVFFSSSVKKIDEYALTIYDKDKATVLKDINVDINGTKYTTSNEKDSKGVIFLDRLEDVMTIKVDGYYDYIFDKDTVNNKKKNIYIEKVKNSSKPYISSVHYKNVSSSKGKWKDASHEEIEIPRNSEELFDIKIYAVDKGSKIKTIRLSQDGKNQIESSDGIFSSVQLTEKFLVGKNIVAYCIAEDGTVSKAFETKINIAPGSDDILENLKNLTEIGLVQNQSFTIPADVPLLGGSKLNLNVGTIPVNVTVDGDTVKIAAGVKEGYDFKDKEWDEYKGWVKTQQKNKDNLKSVRQAIGQKKHTWIGSKGKWQMSSNLSFDVSFFFYWEGSVVDGKLVSKDTGGILTFELDKKFRKGFVLWVIPCFVELELKASLAATASWARPVMDKTIPLEFALNVKFNPSVTAGICAGVPGLANAGIFGKAEFLWDIRFMDKYHEAYVTGKVYAQARTFIWESGEWDLINTKGKKWYWWRDTWGDESNKTLSTNSVSLGAEIFNTESYKVADRSYLEKTKWVGGQTFSTNSISVGNYETKTLQTNIYDDSKQKLVSFGDQKMLVWITDNPNRSAVNRTMLVYSLYDSTTDSWSEPLSVYDDGTADFYPDIISVDDQVYVAWNNLNASCADDVDIETFASGAEICVAKYNQLTKTFEKIKNITNNETLDTSPILASNGTDVRVVWSNNDANDLYGVEGNNSIMCATLSNGEWINIRTLQTGLTAIHSLDAALESDTLYVSYAYDMDNDYNNFDDVEIFQIIDNSEGTKVTRLTNNDVLDSAPSYEYINGETKLFWYSENNLHSLVSLNEKTTETVFENNSAVNDSYVLAQSDIGTNYIIWPQSVGENVAFYSSVYENDGWSEPVLLGSSTGKVLNPTAVVNDDGTLYIAYNNIEQVLVTIEGETDEDDISYYENGQTDLCIMKVNQKPDITVSDENLAFNHSDVVPGAEIPLDLMVTNNSLIMLNDVDIYADGELIETVTVDLLPGQTSEISVKYTLPSTIAYDTLEVTVLPSNTIDANDKDNSVSIEYGYTELTVNSVTVSDTPLKRIISATITNESAVDAGKFNIVIHENDEEGPVVYEETINGLANGSELLINFEVLKEDVEYNEDLLKKYCVEVVTEEKEYLTGNNINYASFSKEEDEGVSGEIHQISFDGSVSNVYATVINNTLGVAYKYAKIEIFDTFGNLIGVYLERLLLSEKELYTIDVSIPLSGNYTEGTATIEIIESGNKDISVEIPDGITEIQDHQFVNCSDLVKINFPDSIKKIGYGAFSGCSSLTEVVLPESIQEIGRGAFTGCESLTSVWIPETLVSIGEEAFWDCPELVLLCFDNIIVAEYAQDVGIEYRLIYGEYNSDTLLSFEIIENQAVITGCIQCLNGEIIIPDTIQGYNVTTIDKSAFVENKDIKSVTLGANVTKIGERAFFGCESLESIVFGMTECAVASYAFYGCSSLRSLDFDGPVSIVEKYAFANCESLQSISFNNNVKSIENLAFYNCESLSELSTENSEYFTVIDGVLYNKAVSEMILCPAKKTGDMVVPSTVISIRPYAAFGCENLTGVQFNDGLQSIGVYAFAECYLIEEVILPDTLTDLGGYAFLYCENARTISTGNGLKSISNFTFGYCEKVESIVIGEQIKTIAANAFAECNSVNRIEYNATECEDFNYSPFSTILSNAENLEIVLGDKVKSVPSNIFNSNSSEKTAITNVVFNDGLETIGDNTFYNCSALSVISLPDSVTDIGNSAFYNCKAATEIVLSDNLEVIGDNAFANCSNVVEINIPDSVKTIGSYAFSNCEKVQTITIGKGVMSIGNSAFYNAYNVCAINYNAIGIKALNSDNYIFYNAGSYCSEVVFSTGQEVEYVPNELFHRDCRVTRVNISDSVKAIGKRAFNNCNRLLELDLGTMVETVDDYAFYNCTRLQSLVISDSVKNIGDYAFYGCGSMQNVTFGNAITSIGTYAFYNCAAQEISLPDSLMILNDYAFANCNYLKSVNLGNSSVEVKSTVFSNCPNLETITGGKGDCVIEDGVLFNSDKTELISCITSKSGTYTIPDTVITICDNAFKDCTNLTDIVIPESVMSIGNNAFYNCYNIQQIVFPDSIRIIGDYAFYNCNSLTKIDLPKRLKNLGYGAFCNCTSVTTLKFGTSLSEINDLAFYYCYSLKELVIPDSVKAIGASAFASCYNLESITIGKNVSYIGNSAFSSCSRVTELNYNAISCEDFNESNNIFYYLGRDSSGVVLNIGDDVKAIPAYFLYPYSRNSYWPNICQVNVGKNIESVGNYAFYCCTALNSFDSESLVNVGISAFYNCNQLQEITFADDSDAEGVIGSGAFQYCYALESVEIPDEVKEIGNNAFYNCTGLKSVDTGNGVETIGDGAFSNCTALETVTIGENVTRIDSSAFYYCTNLRTLNYNAENLESLNLSQNRYNSIFYYAGSATDGFDFIVGDKVKKIPAAMFYPYDNNSSYSPRVKTVTLGSSIETIEDYAFYNCTNLVSVSGGENLVNVGNYAFYNCTSLTSFDSESLVNVGVSAFYNCNQLQEITFADDSDAEGVIGSGAFQYCYALESVVIPNAIKTIGNNAFYNCTGLKSVDTGNGVETIGTSAFSNCTALETVTIGENVTRIDSSAFYYCTNLRTLNYNAENLESLNLSQNRYNSIFYYAGSATDGFDFIVGDKVKKIPAAMFYPYDNNSSYSPRVKTVTLGSSIETIEDYAFYNCTNLVSVSGGENLVNVGNYAFYNCTALTSFKLDYVFGKSGSIGTYAFYNCYSLSSVLIPKNISVIGNYAFTNCSALTILGSYGSTAESYAKQNNIPFLGEGLTILTKPNKINYAVGEQLDLTGLTVVFYDDQYKLNYIEDYTVSGFDSSKSGVRNVKITYNGQSVTFTVFVGFTLPESPHPYNNGMDKSWYINIPEAKSITLTFSEQSYTESCDYIYIYNQDGDQLYSFSGSNIAGRSFTVNDGYIRIRLRTDGSVTYYGFSFSDVHIEYKELMAKRYSTTVINNDRKLIYGLATGLTKETLLNDYVQTADGVRLESSSDIIGTGTTLSVIDAGTDCLIDRYTAVIFGDLTGDGLYDGTDSVLVSSIVNGMLSSDYVGEAVYMAADCNRNGVVDSDDVDFLQNAGLMKVDVSQTGKTALASDFTYDYADDGIVITGLISDDFTTAIIPEQIEGKAVIGIGDYALSYNWSLTSVTIPNSVKSIGVGAFEESGITSIIIPKGVTSIEAYTFNACYSLASVTIAESVTTIGDYAFSECAFSSITIPEGVTSIGYHAFSALWNLTSVTIPASVTNMGESPFYYCEALEHITVDSRNTVYSSDDNGVLFNKDKTDLIQYPIGNKQTNYAIPDSVERIGNNAFRDCYILTSVTIPDSVTTIENCAFVYCYNITNVAIPDSVTSIGECAFEGCYGLTTVTIGNGVTSIGNSAFRYCRELQTVYYNGTIAEWNAINVEENGNEYLVNAEIVFLGEEKPVVDSGECGDNLTWTLYDDGELVIDGTGEMWDYSYDDNTPPWNSHDTIIKSAVVGDGITSIGNFAFCGCSNLTSVMIGNDVTGIGDDAFALCTSLTDVTFGNNVTSIGEEAFYNCDSLVCITIPDSVTIISWGAFMSCISLTSITIGNGVTSIGEHMFEGCISLTSITIPDSVTTIEDYAFAGASLTNVTIGNSVTTIGSDVFVECFSLETVYYNGTAAEWNKISIDEVNEDLLNAEIVFLK